MNALGRSFPQFLSNPYVWLFKVVMRGEIGAYPYRFEIQQKYDAGGKKDTYLNSFEKNEEELLDFSF